MPLDRFVLILVIVIAAAGATIWLAAALVAAGNAPFGWLVAVPLALVAYVAWRVVSDRVSDPEEDKYDSVER